MNKLILRFAAIFLISLNLEIVFLKDIPAITADNNGKGDMISKTLYDFHIKTENHADLIENNTLNYDHDLRIEFTDNRKYLCNNNRHILSNLQRAISANQDSLRIRNFDSIKRVNYYDFEIVGISMRDRKNSIVKILEEIFESPEDFMDQESFEYFRELYGDEWNPPETVNILVVRSRNYLQIGSVQFEWSRMNSRIKKTLLNYSKSNKYKIE